MTILFLATSCLLVGALVGYSAERLLGTSPAAQSAEPTPLYWVAPMDPNFRRDQPGKSPMGMDLVPVYAEDDAAQDESLVQVSPQVENNLGVRTAVVQRSPLAPEVDTVGYIQFDEDTLHHVHTRVDGWIEKLHVAAVGDPVTRGEVLFELYSPALLNAQQEYLSALAGGNQSLIAASRERLLLLGMSATQLEKLHSSRKASRTVNYLSPMDGIVSALNVRHGMFVDPSTEVLAVGRLDSVWVIAEVLERQIAWLETGLPVTMTVDGYPGESWQGTVELVYPELDAKSRTVRVRIRFDNEDGRLRPNMFANLVIEASDKQQRLHIPRAALIRGGQKDRAVVALGDGKYRSVLVRAGMEAGDRVEVLEGLADGDRVVTSAQFLIDSESNIDAESERLGERDAGKTLSEDSGDHSHHNHGGLQP